MFHNMQLWSAVRHALFVEQISKRAACRRFGLNFRTIQKIAQNSVPAGYVRTSSAPTKIAPFLSFIEAYLAEDKTLPSKQRHTRKRIYERLRDEHDYPYSYRLVCKTLEKLRSKEKPLYMPLAHLPGQAQFDFGFADAVIGGVRQQIAYAAMSLTYSNVRYVQAFPRECTETFQEALKRFFYFLGGVPSLITFDNSKVNVAKIVGRRGESVSRGLLQMESWALFQHHFCRIYQPQEKGHVENAVKYVRNNFMVPLPNFPTFAALNDYLEQKCREHFTHTSAGQEKTIGALFEDEKASLQPLPDSDFDARRIEIHDANSLSLVRFDRNDYSVPGDHAHKAFTVIGGIDTVRFLTDGEVVAVHERDWGTQHTHYNPIHYLSIAARRPNGLDFGAPFAAWHLPPSFDVLRRRLETQAGKQGKREYIRILRLLERFSLEQLTHGIERALDSNTTAYEGVRLYVECEATVPVELFSLDGRPLLQQVLLPEPNLNLYSTLLERSDDEETRNETDGAFETSFTAVETAEFRAGMRRDGVSMCEGEHRPSGIPAPISGAGTVGSGGSCGRAAFEGSAVSEFEDAGVVRVSSPAEFESTSGESTDARGVHRESGVDHSDWSAGDGQDAFGNGIWNQGVSDGKEGTLLSGGRSDYATLGGERGETTATNEKEFGDPGRDHFGRTGLCPGEQGRKRIVL